jgi:hypothetical protein
MSEHDYVTPGGKRAFYATTPLAMRQHLVLGLFPTQTMCGHPVRHWSSSEIRTPIGMTCRACIRNTTKIGKARSTFGAWILYLIVRPVFAVYEWRQAKKQEPETIDVADLFPDERTP